MTAMTSTPSPGDRDPVFYPTRDGRPMAETELHGDEMTELKVMLRRHFKPEADAVYVGCNLFVYYEEGNPKAVFSPDVFVARGTPQRQRDTYKLWLDGPAPCCVFEVTSKSSRVEDRGNKMAVCEMLGVREYFLYDPRGEYLDPPLSGFRLSEGIYQPIVKGEQGRLFAETLDLSLSLGHDGLIELHDSSGRRLLRIDEERQHAERERHHAERERQRAERERDHERQRAEAAERKLAEALARLEAERR